MTEHPTFGEFILGFEGLAILRSWGLDPGTVQERARSIAEVVGSRGETPWSTPLVETEYEVQTGYGEWAPGYDRPDNPVLLAEEPVVREIVDAVPIGTALDAACGTGRWAQHLASLGHDVTGFDATPEMLEAARRKVPAAHFELADLTAIPLPPESCDLVVARSPSRTSPGSAPRSENWPASSGRVGASSSRTCIPSCPCSGLTPDTPVARKSSDSSRIMSTRCRTTCRLSGMPG